MYIYWAWLFRQVNMLDKLGVTFFPFIFLNPDLNLREKEYIKKVKKHEWVHWFQELFFSLIGTVILFWVYDFKIITIPKILYILPYTLFYVLYILNYIILFFMGYRTGEEKCLDDPNILYRALLFEKMARWIAGV